MRLADHSTVRSQAPSGPINDPFSIAPIRTAIRAAVFDVGPQQFEILEAQVSHGRMSRKRFQLFYEQMFI